MPFVDHKKVLRCSPRLPASSVDQKVLRCSPRPSAALRGQKGVKVFSRGLPASSVDQKVLKCSPCPFVPLRAPSWLKGFLHSPSWIPPSPLNQPPAIPKIPKNPANPDSDSSNPSPHRRTSPYPLSPSPCPSPLPLTFDPFRLQFPCGLLSWNRWRCNQNPYRSFRRNWPPGGRRAERPLQLSYRRCRTGRRQPDLVDFAGSG